MCGGMGRMRGGKPYRLIHGTCMARAQGAPNQFITVGPAAFPGARESSIIRSLTRLHAERGQSISYRQGLGCPRHPSLRRVFLVAPHVIILIILIV
jgi:hypothetical protein